MEFIARSKRRAAFWLENQTYDDFGISESYYGDGKIC